MIAVIESAAGAQVESNLGNLMSLRRSGKENNQDGIDKKHREAKEKGLMSRGGNHGINKKSGEAKEKGSRSEGGNRISKEGSQETEKQGQTQG